MEKPFLIQRLKKPFKNPTINDNALSFGGGLKYGGISGEGLEMIKYIFRFDYMGSSEFEWGILPKTLNKIWENKANYVTFKIDAKTKEKKSGKVYVICENSMQEEVMDWIKKMAFDENTFDGNDDTKESVRLKDAINELNVQKSKLAMLEKLLNLLLFWRARRSISNFGVYGWLELDNGFFFFIDWQMFEKTKKLFDIS